MTRSPMTRSRPSSPDRPLTAAFWDIENSLLTLKDLQRDVDPDVFIPAVMAQIRSYGPVDGVHVYLDTRLYPLALRRCLESHGSRIEDVPAIPKPGGGLKSVVDVALAIDMVETVYDNDAIRLVILVSGDADFIRPLNHLRNRGIDTVVLGIPGTTSRHLIRAAGVFEALAIPDRPASHQVTNAQDSVSPRHHIAAGTALVPSLSPIQADLIRFLVGQPPRPFLTIAADLHHSGRIGQMSLEEAKQHLNNLVKHGSLKQVTRVCPNGSIRRVMAIDRDNPDVKNMTEQITPGTFSPFPTITKPDSRELAAR